MYLAAQQLDRLNALLADILPRNAFYTAKLGPRVTILKSFEDFARLPFTTKQELSANQADKPPYGDVLTYPRERYTRLCQTSGTMGQPLRWLDTPESWQWMLDCWKKYYEIAGMRPGDRLFFAFSFGPFLGFWTAFESACQLGCLCLPGGGMSSASRLRCLLDNAADVVLCTPTYALQLAETARHEGIDLRSGPVRKLIVAGEQGGSIPTTRSRIEQAWNARVFDHHGMTEIGPVTIECQNNPAGLHVLETEYIMEVIDLEGQQPVPAGQTGELVLTNLGRIGSPLIRYRTGDLVSVDPKPCPCGLPLRRLAGGILGRADDMITVRGNNLFPAALEATLRQWPEVAEFRVETRKGSELGSLRIDVEPATVEQGRGLAEKIQESIRAQYLFRPEVTVVPPGTLPRFDMKAKRFHRLD
jgi:phenylacetate-CoA ligase